MIRANCIFADYREVDGRDLPGRLEVHYGNNIYGIFKLTDISFQPAAADPSRKESQPATDNSPDDE